MDVVSLTSRLTIELTDESCKEHKKRYNLCKLSCFNNYKINFFILKTIKNKLKMKKL